MRCRVKFVFIYTFYFAFPKYMIEELNVLIRILLLDWYEILRAIKDLQIYGNPSIPLLYVAIYSVKSYNTMGYILRTRKFPNTTEDTKWYLQFWSSIIVIIWTEHQIALQSQLGENLSGHKWITCFI